MLFPTIYQTLAIPKHYMTCCRSRPQFPSTDPTPLRSWATWYTSVDEDDDDDDTVACSHTKSSLAHTYYSSFRNSFKTHHSVIRYGNKKLSWG